MKRSIITLSLGMLAAAQFSGTASASYMETCSALIGEWETCRETSADCKSETVKIETNCKCHVQKGDEWKLVMAAVADDGVCGTPPEDIVIPPPPPPPTRNFVKPNAGAGNGGDKGDGEHRGDDRS